MADYTHRSEFWFSIHRVLTQSCPTFRCLLDWSPPGSSVHGISQARILEWMPFPSPGDLPNPGVKPESPVSPALQAGSPPAEPSGKPQHRIIWHLKSAKKRVFFNKECWDNWEAIRKKQDIRLLSHSKINSVRTRKINTKNKPTKHLKKTKETLIVSWWGRLCPARQNRSLKFFFDKFKLQIRKLYIDIIF